MLLRFSEEHHTIRTGADIFKASLDQRSSTLVRACSSGNVLIGFKVHQVGVDDRVLDVLVTKQVHDRKQFTACLVILHSGLPMPERVKVGLFKPWIVKLQGYACMQQQEIEPLIREEAYLFAKYLRNERKMWNPRIANCRLRTIYDLNSQGYSS